MDKQSLRHIWRQYRLTGLRQPPQVVPSPVSHAPRVLLTVGFGLPYAAAARRLERQARTAGWFDRIWCITDGCTEFGLAEFLSSTHALRQQHKIGYGLWAWKPYLVQRVLEQIPMGAHLYYIDAGCEISPLGGQRFLELDAWLEQHSGLFFELPFLERDWTKPELFRRFGDLQQTHQIQATWFGIKKNPDTESFVQCWNRLAQDNDQGLLKDDRAGPKDHAHRHDQSLLSCILKSSYSHFRPLPWEDFFAPWLYHQNSEILLAPVHSLRSRGEQSQLDSLTAHSSLAGCRQHFQHHRFWKLLKCLPKRCRHALQDEAMIALDQLRKRRNRRRSAAASLV